MTEEESAQQGAATDNHPHHDLLHLTILVAGTPEQRDYPAEEKVEAVIKSLLPVGQRHDWEQYELRERNATAALDPFRSLQADGVDNHDVLSLTKRDGGGGNR